MSFEYVVVPFHRIQTLKGSPLTRYSATLRGKDKLGFALVGEAVRMNWSLPLPKIVIGFDLAAKQYARARRCLAAAVVNLSL